MKSAPIIAFAAVAAVFLQLAAATVQADFHAYAVAHKKPYLSNKDEYNRRAQIFAANIQIIESHRQEMLAAGVQPWMGVNEFTDMTADEFRVSGRVMRNRLDAGADATSCLANGVTADYSSVSYDIPDSFDWREKGVVSPVQNQGGCGSCWAFSTAAAIESAYAVKTGNLTKLSEQEIVDCSTACITEDNQQVCNQGCNGGWPWAAMYDVISWKGLETESAYPYTGETGTCQRGNQPVFDAIRNYTCLSGPKSANETDMAAFLVANGPLSISMDAGLLQFYFGGVIHPRLGDCSKTSLDHAIVIVGYGVSGSDKYWIVRNSWGESWGEKGYFRIVRGEGACGLNNGVVFPIV